MARRVASSVDVDDLLQEIFVRMHRGLAGLREEERFGGWVYRIAHGAIVDRARQRARSPHVAAAAAEGADTPGDSAEGTLQSDLSECVALFVSRLPSPYREAITLTELEGLTQKEAAEMLGVSHFGLKVAREHGGRERLRAHMFDELLPCPRSRPRQRHRMRAALLRTLRPDCETPRRRGRCARGNLPGAAPSRRLVLEQAD